jgi:hypothetical protein
MDAINSLAAGARAAEAVFDTVAQQVAAADLPTTANPSPTNPVAAAPRAGDGDLVGQLVTMKVAADTHHVTTAALRSAFSLYHDSIDLLRPERGPESES